jgi:hypothetical protein
MKKTTIIMSSLFLSLCACKEDKNKDEAVKKKKTEIINNSTIGKTRNNWVFYKSVPLSKGEYVCDATKFKSLIIDISGDSVFISNKYSDNVYRNKISAESFFDHTYLLNSYKKMLKDEFEISLPNKIESIRNKRAYDKDSQLDKYFQDAFFVDNYMFIESDGCVMVFKKNNENKIVAAESECEDVAIEMGSGKICTIRNSSFIKEYGKIISNNLVEESWVLPKQMPITDSIINVNKNGLIDIEFKIKSNKIEIAMNYEGGVTEIVLEKNENNIKRGIYYYAD